MWKNCDKNPQKTRDSKVERFITKKVIPAFLTNNAIAIYIILIEKRFWAFFTRLIFDAVSKPIIQIL
jgi:hypothetical protein